MLSENAGGKMAKAGLLTPSQQAKSIGLDSLKQVSRLSNVSEQTLINWHKNKPELFEIVLLGCAAAKERTWA